MVKARALIQQVGNGLVERRVWRDNGGLLAGTCSELAARGFWCFEHFCGRRVAGNVVCCHYESDEEG